MQMYKISPPNKRSRGTDLCSWRGCRTSSSLPCLPHRAPTDSAAAPAQGAGQIGTSSGHRLARRSLAPGSRSALLPPAARSLPGTLRHDNGGGAEGQRPPRSLPRAPQRQAPEGKGTWRLSAGGSLLAAPCWRGPAGRLSCEGPLRPREPWKL